MRIQKGSLLHASAVSGVFSLVVPALLLYNSILNTPRFDGAAILGSGGGGGGGGGGENSSPPPPTHTRGSLLHAFFPIQ